MRHVVVKEVTSPVHDASGMTVVFRPGEQFPADEDLPEGVPWKWAVAVAADAPAKTSGAVKGTSGPAEAAPEPAPQKPGPKK